jgi:hypothetical protein
MIKHKTRQVTKVVTETVSREATCDICGRKSPRRDAVRGDSINWATEEYDIDAIIIAHEVGSIYPEGGSLEIESFHLCVVCWAKMVTWIQSENPAAKPTIRENEW